LQLLIKENPAVRGIDLLDKMVSGVKAGMRDGKLRFRQIPLSSGIFCHFKSVHWGRIAKSD
jgi:hypothetical protein